MATELAKEAVRFRSNHKLLKDLSGIAPEAVDEIAALLGGDTTALSLAHKREILAHPKGTIWLGEALARAMRVRGMLAGAKGEAHLMKVLAGDVAGTDNKDQVAAAAALAKLGDNHAAAIERSASLRAQHKHDHSVVEVLLAMHGARAGGDGGEVIDLPADEDDD